MTRLADNDLDELERLVRSLRPCLLDRARQLERSEARAQDLVQDAFERALRNFHRFQPGTNARAWLLKIMSNLFLDRCRRPARERLSDPSTLNEWPAPEPEPRPPWEDIEPVHVHAALTRLTPPFKDVLDLYVNRRRSYAEIASNLGIPLGTVGTRINRARKKMKTLLVGPDASADAARARPLDLAAG